MAKKTWRFGDPNPRSWAETANILKEAEKRHKRRDYGFITEPVIKEIHKVVKQVVEKK